MVVKVELFIYSTVYRLVMNQIVQTTLKMTQTYSMPFNFDETNDMPFSCPNCPEKTYKLFIGIANHYIRKHFEGPQ